MTKQLDPLLHDLMRKAADKAILPHYQHLSASEISEKAADDFVTIADHESEALLAEGLARILPDAALVGEEAAHADAAVLRNLSGLCWIIDPLDGTYNFAHGRPPFGIIIALADGGVTQAGWLYDPLSGRFCSAHRGEGAFINGQRITAFPSGHTPPIAAISLLFLEPARRERIAHVIAPHYQLVDIPRCAAEQYPRLALGQNDISIFERTLAWDHAAGVLFLNEAGGKAARPDGSAYRVDDPMRTGLLGAASPALWEELAKRMAQI